MNCSHLHEDAAVRIETVTFRGGPTTASERNNFSARASTEGLEKLKASKVARKKAKVIIQGAVPSNLKAKTTRSENTVRQNGTQQTH